MAFRTAVMPFMYSTSRLFPNAMATLEQRKKCVVGCQCQTDGRGNTLFFSFDILVNEMFKAWERALWNGHEIIINMKLCSFTTFWKEILCNHNLWWTKVVVLVLLATTNHTILSDCLEQVLLFRLSGSDHISLTGNSSSPVEIRCQSRHFLWYCTEQLFWSVTLSDSIISVAIVAELYDSVATVDKDYWLL